MRRILALALASALAGCALPGNVVVVLPDENGNTGLVEVSNPNGNTELNRPMAAASSNLQAPPSQPFIAEQSPVTKVFGKVLESIPRKPVEFLVFFQPGTAVPAPASRGDLAAAIEAARNTPDPEIGLVAYIDRTDIYPPGQPDPMPLLRARHIRDLLVRAGISPAAIDISDYGSAEPLLPTTMVPGPRAPRVEVTIR